MPAVIDLPSLETLLLTRVVGAEALQVQRLVAACPRLADLTLEACAELATLSLGDKQRLRRLSLRACHKMAGVAADASELRVFEYSGAVPAPSFLTLHGPPRMISSCTLDFRGQEPSHPSSELWLRDFLHHFAGATHLHLKSVRLGHDASSSAPALQALASLRHLELTGLSSPHDDATVAAAVARVLEQTPSLGTLSLFFLPDPRIVLPEPRNDGDASYDPDAILDVHQLRPDVHAAGLAVPDGAGIPCLRRRVKEINLVHYQGGVSQRMLAKFLLGNATAMEALCCAFAPGPLRMQTKLMEELSGWVINKSAKMIFV